MQRFALLALSAPMLALSACGGTETVTTDIRYPDLNISQGMLEFGVGDASTAVERTIILSNDGEMPMGVDEIVIGENMGANFTVSYLVSEKECPVTEGGGDTASEASGDAKSLDIDTGPVDTGGTDTGGSDTGGPVDDSVLFVLEPGCTIPLHVSFLPVDLGEIWGAVIVNSKQAEVADPESNDLPEYLRDPIHWRQEVFLHGSAERSQGTLIVRPRSYDFGFVHPDAGVSAAYVGLENVGTGPLTITSVALSECDAAFSLGTVPPAKYVLDEGVSALVEVLFDPSDDDAAYCQVLVTSSDPANPSVEVTLTGNSGTDPNNHPPTVAIRSPENGYRYSTSRDLEMELNIFDVDQPATSLSCRIASAVLENAVVGDCTAPDDSGHFWVTVPADNLDSGIDTLVVTVTDGNGVSTEASVSVVIDSGYSDTDDDGDGYGTEVLEEGQQVDCDDTNRFTYPEAAEVFDGDDNDCDGIVDEGTVGFDDDGDSISENDGDCNDYNENAYPGGPERPDGVDNDCDGTVDEGTSLSDDDGDGYAEVNNDCNDTDPAVNPAAEELCDGIDNDCDGLRDSADGCVASSSSPLIIGELNPSQNACEEGDTIQIEVRVFDPDGQVPTLAWQDDSGQTGLFDNAAASVVNWTCPTLEDGSGGKAFNVWVTVTDPDAQQDYQFTKIAVYPEGYGLYEPYTLVELVPREGCATTGGSPVGALALLGAGLALGLRRRS